MCRELHGAREGRAIEVDGTLGGGNLLLARNRSSERIAIAFVRRMETAILG